MLRTIRPIILGALLAAVVATPAPAADPARIYVSADRAQLLELTEPVKKVAVANPNIADVHVISPTQLLVNARSVGVTSLVAFTKRGMEAFEVVVHPSPVAVPRAPVPADVPHAVLVHRADRVSNHLFVRDAERAWIELGSVKPETDADKQPQAKLDLPLPKK